MVITAIFVSTCMYCLNTVYVHIFKHKMYNTCIMYFAYLGFSRDFLIKNNGDILNYSLCNESSQPELSSFAASRFILAKLQGATTYSCDSFMEWLLWLEDISLTFLPQSIYLHSNTSLHLTKFWKNQDLDCELRVLYSELYGHTHRHTHTRGWYRWMCKCRKKKRKKKQTCKQTDLYGWLDSAPAKCQIGRCFISASDSLDFHLFTLSHNPVHVQINYDSAKCCIQVDCLMTHG